ncbi:hypothetical protein [Streptomyces sp. NPDC029554]|uniref:hypothetical protein n=1 Tax=Streptomyces sp. NPDC029554 TaxID=3155126 RepID=UPI0034102EBF
MSTATSWLAPVVIGAALAMRVVFGELRRPGSTRQGWTFATDATALTGGAVAGGAVILLGWPTAGPAAVAWALLVAALASHLLHRRGPRP